MNRTEIERRSAVVLVVLSQRPKWLLGLVAAGLLAGVVLGTPAIAAPCTVVLVAVLAWLSYLSWPITPPAARGMRLLALALLIALGARSILG